MIVSIIAAVAKNRAIGKDNEIPWRLKGDLKHFQKITMGHHMIMGRKTYESIGEPLPGRDTIVVTRDPNYYKEGCFVVHSLEEALQLAEKRGESEVFIVGGEEIYQQALKLADKMYITKVHALVDADAFFPEYDERNWVKTHQTNHESNAHNQFSFSIAEYEKVDIHDKRNLLVQAK